LGDANFTIYGYGVVMYTRLGYKVSRRHGDGRIGLVARGAGRAADVAGTGHVGSTP